MTAAPDADRGETPQFWRPPDAEAAWMATARFGLRQAPGGLAAVQDLLNTGAQPSRFGDLLATMQGARKWSMRAALAWSRDRRVQVHEPVLVGDDLEGLRDLRGIVEGWVTHRTAADSARELGAVTLSLSRSGELGWVPAGDGWRWWAATVCAEILASREKGTWSRLKQCATPTCRVVFYDRAWDNGGLLHASACGV
jgi:predicted RNA-binding Zn ribbon-like protein